MAPPGLFHQTGRERAGFGIPIRAVALVQGKELAAGGRGHCRAEGTEAPTEPSPTRGSAGASPWPGELRRGDGVASAPRLYCARRNHCSLEFPVCGYRYDQPTPAATSAVASLPQLAGALPRPLE